MASLFDSNGNRKCCPVCGTALRRGDARTCSRECNNNWSRMSPEAKDQVSKTIEERSKKLWADFQRKYGVRPKTEDEGGEAEETYAEPFDINKIIKD